MQKCCNNLVIMEIPESDSATLQAISRVFRLGQTKVSCIWIVTVNHSYDQVLQARNAQKMRAQIAGQGAVDPTEEEVEVAMSRPENKDLDREAVRAALMNINIDEVHMEMLGLRSTRHHEPWMNQKNFFAKDKLPSENTNVKPRSKQSKLDGYLFRNTGPMTRARGTLWLPLLLLKLTAVNSALT
jgi:hypothetical protein